MRILPCTTVGPGLSAEAARVIGELSLDFAGCFGAVGTFRTKTIGRAPDGDAVNSSVSRFLLRPGDPASLATGLTERLATVRGPGPATACVALSSEPLLISTGFDTTLRTMRIGRAYQVVGMNKYQ